MNSINPVEVLNGLSLGVDSSFGPIQVEEAAGTTAQVIEALDNAAASLETLLLKFGPRMSAEDRRARELVLAEAQAALVAARYRDEEE